MKFGTGIQFTKSNFEGRIKDYDFFYYIEDIWLYSSSDVMRIPVSIEYSLPGKRIQPFATATYNNILYLNSESYYQNMTPVPYDNSRYTYSRPHELAARKYNMGFCAGFGLYFNITPKTYLKTYIAYELSLLELKTLFDNKRIQSGFFNIAYGVRLRDIQ